MALGGGRGQGSWPVTQKTRNGVHSIFQAGCPVSRM